MLSQNHKCAIRNIVRPELFCRSLVCCLHTNQALWLYSLGGWVVSFSAAWWSWLWFSTILDCYVEPVVMINMLLQQPGAAFPTREETFLWRKFHLFVKNKMQTDTCRRFLVLFLIDFEEHMYEENFCYKCMCWKKIEYKYLLNILPLRHLGFGKVKALNLLLLNEYCSYCICVNLFRNFRIWELGQIIGSVYWICRPFIFLIYLRIAEKKTDIQGGEKHTTFSDQVFSALGMLFEVPSRGLI